MFPTTAAVACRQHLRIAEGRAVDVALQEDHGEAVALLNAVEVHRPGEDLGQLKAQQRVHARTGQVVVQRTGDLHLHGALGGGHRPAVHLHAQRQGGGEDHLLHGIGLVHEVAQLAVGVIGEDEGDGVAGPHAPHIEGALGHPHQAVHHRIRHPVRGQQVAEGAAAAHLAALHHEAVQRNAVGARGVGDGVLDQRRHRLGHVLHRRRQVNRHHDAQHQQQQAGHRAPQSDPPHGWARNSTARSGKARADAIISTARWG